MEEIEQRIVRYWTKRTRSFCEVRENELSDKISERWMEEMLKYLPSAPARILDIGTGVGYFALLLSKQGYEVTGIDLTPSMIDEARILASRYSLKTDFQLMDAMHPEFADESFDAIVTRNLTWTLPDVPEAYREWYRILKKDGVLLNFDAHYIGSEEKQNNGSVPYGHTGITKEMEKENAEITSLMPIYQTDRPAWDLASLKEAGFENCEADPSAGTRILQERDLPESPLFMIYARK